MFGFVGVSIGVSVLGLSALRNLLNSLVFRYRSIDWCFGVGVSIDVSVFRVVGGSDLLNSLVVRLMSRCWLFGLSVCSGFRFEPAKLVGVSIQVDHVLSVRLQPNPVHPRQQ